MMDLRKMQGLRGARTPARGGLIGAVRARLRSQRGESITEVLAAIVVGGLATLMLATATTAAVNVNHESASAMDDYYQAGNELVAKQASPSGEGDVGTVVESGSVTLLDEAGTPVKLAPGEDSVSVEYAINSGAAGAAIVSYKASERGAGA